MASLVLRSVGGGIEEGVMTKLYRKPVGQKRVYKPAGKAITLKLDYNFTLTFEAN